MSRSTAAFVLAGIAFLALSRGADGAPQERAPLRVWAAASIGQALEGAGTAWEAAGGKPVSVNADASSRLAVQVREGAPADILVTADREWMEWAVDDGVVDAASVRVVATNRLCLITARDGPTRTVTASELTELLTELGPGTRIGIAGEEVPAGRYAREVIDALGLGETLSGRLVTGGNVRSVVEWVARGELPLGFAYLSDVLAGDDRIGATVVIPGDLHTPVEIVGGVVRGGDEEGAEAFLAFLTAPPGSSVLSDGGFLPVGNAATTPPARVAPTTARTAVAGVSVGSAIRLSVWVALVATLLAVVPAVAVGWLLARRPFVGKSLVSALILTPLVIPPVVTGFILLTLFGQGSPVGRALGGLGLTVPFTFLAAVLAAVVVGFPLFVITVRNAFEAADPRLEEVSWTLGSPPRRTFFRVSLPLALPGIGAGAVLAFARALGEFGATVVLAGNLEGETRTIALAVYTLLESPGDRAAIWWLVGASVVVSMMALAGFEYLSRRQRRLVRRDADA